MDQVTRERVRRRAGERCEYCHLPMSALTPAQFHIEHVTARQHQGSDELDNLALACERCNLNKGPNVSAVDPETGQVVLLFHPRRDSWSTHFVMRGHLVAGRTSAGRATVRLLQMNTPARVRLRAKLG
jgi:hypothetical protein